MANNPRQAPFSITGSASTDANGKPTASATIGGATYTCSGDNAVLAIGALSDRLVMEGCDPGCALTVGVNTIQDIISTI